MTEIDLNDLVTRLLLFAEGSRRSCKQEKDSDEALIHQNRVLVLDDAAVYIETRDTEIKRLRKIAALARGLVTWWDDPEQYGDNPDANIEGMDELRDALNENEVTKKDEETP